MVSGIAAIGFLSGCMAGNNKDLGNHPEFRSVVGRNVSLQRQTYVFLDKDGFMTMPPYRIDDYSEAYGMLVNGTNQNFTNFGICTLPIGYSIHIDSVRLKVGFDSGSSPTALGHLVLPTSHEEVRFYFNWGLTSHAYTYLKRAPWEPSTVPLRRYVPSLYP